MEKPLNFSLADLSAVVRQGKRFLILGSLLGAILAFSYLLTRPVHFTARGIFKGQASPTNNQIFKALEFLGMEDTYAGSEDPLSFLRSYPVLEQVVQKLHLQATVTETDKGKRFKEIWHTIQAALAYSRSRPSSQILTSDIPVADHLAIPDDTPSIFCSSLDYPAETFSSLTLHFLDEATFKVINKGSMLGNGHLDAPFTWEKGSFTLSGKGGKGKIYGLDFIPMTQAVQSLQNSLIIKRDKDNLCFVHVRYTHRDRHLAASIVNETMEQFQNYLSLMGKKKITQQLAYLRQRQEETLGQLESTFAQEKAYLESNLGSGIILSLEKELEFMAQTQIQKKQKLLEIQAEMQNLAQDHLPFTELLTHFSAHAPSLSAHALSVESAHESISRHQEELDRLHLDGERYAYCLEKLATDHFDCASLAKILNDPSLQSHFEKIDTYHCRLIDEMNWSETEREQFTADLEIEKNFMKEHVERLKEGNELHAKAIEARILSLRDALLYLLADRYNQEMSSLAALTEQVKHFPQKWLNEQKIALNTQLYKDMMESITKMIEAKNIGFHLDFLLSQVLKPARPPVLPDPPYLILGSLLGGIIGLFSVILVLGLFGIWKGPLASYHNLIQAGKRVIPPPDTIPLLGLALAELGPVVLLTARYDLSFAGSLIEWLKRKGDSVYVIDLTSPSSGGGDWAFLASSSFKQQLDSYKQTYNRIVILSVGSVQGYTTQALLKCSDAIVYGVWNETLEVLETLPEKTIFILQPAAARHMVSLKGIAPMLDRLLRRSKRSSSSVAKRAWEDFSPSKKI